MFHGDGIPLLRHDAADLHIVPHLETLIVFFGKGEVVSPAK